MTEIEHQKRFVFLGMQGRFTFYVLSTFLERQCKPQAIIIYGDDPQQAYTDISGIRIEVSSSGNSLLPLARKFDVSLEYVRNKQLFPTLSKHTYDYIVTACWPMLLSEQILSSASEAAVNIHPSLLPLYRGARPIRDQLATRDQDFGVTVHKMNQRYDMGEIISQEALEKPYQENFKVIEKRCAIAGAGLVVQLIRQNKTG